MARSALLDEYLRDPLMTAEEVAQVFKVAPVTVGRWHRAGKLTAERIPLMHALRFRASHIRAVLEGNSNR